MAEIIIQPDCGNSPKKLFLKNLYIAYAEADSEFVTANVPEQVSWERIGRDQLTGNEKFIEAMRSYKLWNVRRLVVDAIITHGVDASVNGRVLCSDRSEYAFCDVYRFVSAGKFDIRTITSFLIRL